MSTIPCKEFILKNSRRTVSSVHLIWIIKSLIHIQLVLLYPAGNFTQVFLLSAQDMDMTIPTLICHLQASHSEMLGGPKGPGPHNSSVVPNQLRFPNTEGVLHSQLGCNPFLQALRQVLPMSPKADYSPNLSGRAPPPSKVTRLLARFEEMLKSQSPPSFSPGAPEAGL